MVTWRKKLARLALPGRARKFIAVDFDSRSLRIVQAAPNGSQTKILTLTQVDMPEEIDLDDARAVGEFLGKTLSRLKLRGSGVLMNVPRGQAMLKPVTLPPGTAADEIATMLRFQVEKELPYEVGEAVIDYTLASHFDVDAHPDDGAPGVSVLAAVVKRPVVDHYKAIAAAANVRLLRLGLRPYAILQCADACLIRSEEESLAAVFLTADETEINVLVGRSLTFTRSAVVPIRPPQSGSDPAVKETVDLLVSEIAHSLQSYQTVHGGRTIDAALLAGGTGVESRVAMELAKRMKVQCHTFDPSGALGLRESSPETSAFMAAIGLAIGHRGAAPPFDFLAPKEPTVRRDLRKVRRLGLVTMFVAALLTGVLLVRSHLGAKEAVLRGLQRSYSKLKKKDKSVASLGRYVKAIHEWEEGDRDWLGHWANLSGVFPPCQQVYIDGFKTNSSDGSVSFIVRAVEDGYVDNLCESLSSAGYEFRRLRSATAGADQEEYRSRTDMRIIIPREMNLKLASLTPQPRPPDDNSLTAFKPGSRLPPSDTTPVPTGSRSGVYGPRPTTPSPTTPRPATPRPTPRPVGPTTPRPGGVKVEAGPVPLPEVNLGELSPAERERFREWCREMPPRLWEREIQLHAKKLKGPPTREQMVKYRASFQKRMEMFWRRELEKSRIKNRTKSSSSKNGSSKHGRSKSDRRRGDRQ